MWIGKQEYAESDREIDEDANCKFTNVIVIILQSAINLFSPTPLSSFERKVKLSYVFRDVWNIESVYEIASVGCVLDEDGFWSEIEDFKCIYLKNKNIKL